MSKVTKKDLNERLLMVETLLGLHRALPEQISNDQANNAIFRMQCALSSGKESAERKPPLKQLDQSVFDGLDEKWRFAAVDKGGAVWVYSGKPDRDCGYWFVKELVGMSIGRGYDASNWQNSLIERDDIAKELLEVDLSSELTGSEYFHSNTTSALLESGSKLVVCFVSDISELKALSNKRIEVITSLDTNFNDSDGYGWQYAVPINNQGEPLSAAEAGF